MPYLQITFRVIIIMGLLLAIVLITGRRKIGELPVFDFLTVIVIGNIVGADIADPKVPQMPTAYAVVLLICTQYILSYFVIKSRKLGKKITFEPIVIIQNGQFIKSNMKKVRYTIENVLMFLREKGVFDINEVEFAIVEDSGNLSIMKKSHFQPLTPNDTNTNVSYKGLTIPLIVEGKVNENNLQQLNLNKAWLKEELKKNNIHTFEEVFYLDINTQGKLSISKSNQEEDSKNNSIM